MTFLKTVFVLLFSFALISTQTVFSTSAAPVPECDGCACAKPSCCLKTSTPENPQPLSAPAAHSISHEQFQFFVAAISFLLPLPEFNSAKISSKPAAFSTAKVVPLYQRNCTYLI